MCRIKPMFPFLCMIWTKCVSRFCLNIPPFCLTKCQDLERVSGNLNDESWRAAYSNKPPCCPGRSMSSSCTTSGSTLWGPYGLCCVWYMAGKNTCRIGLVFLVCCGMCGGKARLAKEVWTQDQGYSKSLHFYNNMSHHIKFCMPHALKCLTD